MTVSLSTSSVPLFRIHSYLPFIGKWISLSWLQKLLPISALKKHSYIVARSGSGKSELIKSLLLLIKVSWKLTNPVPKILSSRSVVLLDPHGDVARECAQNRLFVRDLALCQKVGTVPNLVFISPLLHPHLRPSINPFDLTGKHLERADIEVMAQDLSSAFTAMISRGDWKLSAQMKMLLKPLLEVLLTVSQESVLPCTFFDLENLLGEKPSDRMIARGRAILRNNFFSESEFFHPRLASTKFALMMRLRSLLNSRMFVDLLCQPRSTWDLEKLMNSGKTILIDASKACLGNDVSEMYGRTITALMTSYAFARSRKQERKSLPSCFLVLDEASTFVSDSIPTILEELRKFGVHLTLVNQVVRQGGTSGEYHNAVMGNTAVKIVGISGSATRMVMAKELNVNAEAFRTLRVGQFLVGVDGHGVKRVVFPRHFLGHRYAMSPTEWHRVLDFTLATYYRPPGEEVAISKNSPAPILFPLPQ